MWQVDQKETVLNSLYENTETICDFNIQFMAMHVINIVKFYYEKQIEPSHISNAPVRKKILW